MFQVVKKDLKALPATQVFPFAAIIMNSDGADQVVIELKQLEEDRFESGSLGIDCLLSDVSPLKVYCESDSKECHA